MLCRWNVLDIDAVHHVHRVGSYTPTPRGRKRSADGVVNITGPVGPCTKSSTQPLKKNWCFSCKEANYRQLFDLNGENAGQGLEKAVSASSDRALKMRYNTSIADSAAHAMDLKYQKG